MEAAASPCPASSHAAGHEHVLGLLVRTIVRPLPVTPRTRAAPGPFQVLRRVDAETAIGGVDHAILSPLSSTRSCSSASSRSAVRRKGGEPLQNSAVKA